MFDNAFKFDNVFKFVYIQFCLLTHNLKVSILDLTCGKSYPKCVNITFKKCKIGL